MRNKLLGLLLITLLMPQSVKAEDISEETIVHEVEKEIQPMPTCSDEKLISATKEFISQYYLKNKQNKNVKYRRRQYFITHNLDKFSKENIANYKTSETSSVSNIIADRLMNKNIIEENMLLCKSQSPNKEASELYLLIYPEGEGYHVEVINLAQDTEETSFIYK